MVRFLLCLSFLLMSACIQQEPTIFDVPQNTWNQLTPAQQQQAIDIYRERQWAQERRNEIRTQNEPLTQALGILDTLFEKTPDNEEFY